MSTPLELRAPRSRNTILRAVALVTALLASFVTLSIASPADATVTPDDTCYETQQYTEHQYKKQTRIVSQGKITGNVSYGDWSWYSPTSTKWSETETDVLEGPAYHSDYPDSTLYYRWREYRYYTTGQTRVKERQVEVECEPGEFEVIPAKYWDFGGGPIPADGSATIEIDAGAAGSKSWTFNTSGGFIGDDTPLVLPTGTGYSVSEPTFTNPVGWSCEQTQVRLLVAQPVLPRTVETVTNACDEVVKPDPKVEVDVQRQVDCVADVVIVTTTTTTTDWVWDGEQWVLGEPVVEVVVTTEAYEGQPCDTTTTTTSTTVPNTTTTVPDTTTTTEEPSVGGITDEGTLGSGSEAGVGAGGAGQLPRTGAGFGGLLLVSGLLTGLGATLRLASRRLR